MSNSGFYSGFVKKTQKIPLNQIRIAKEYRIDYQERAGKE